MLVVSTEEKEGYDLEMLGVVKGGVVHSKNAFRDFGAGLKTIVGGEIKAYTDMMNEARDLATRRMVEEAVALGADAVVGLRYASAAIMQGASEVMAYGTAVKARKK